jgi:hypothetical protein
VLSNIFNRDFQEFISLLNEFSVEYILVGGYSVILHGYSRTTGDLDIWVNPSLNNYKRMIKACSKFGLMLDDLTEQNFLRNNSIDVFTFGQPPVSIDIMKAVKGLDFQDTYKDSLVVEIDSIPTRVIHKNHLIMSKKASNRPKDQDDIIHLSSEK